MKENAVTLGYGSHVREPTPKQWRTMKIGELLTLDSEAPNGNVWFIDPQGNRAKIECGQVSNLTKRGDVMEMPEGKLTVDQCLEQFRNYAKTQTHPNPDSKFTLNFCANFLAEFCVGATLPTNDPNT